MEKIYLQILRNIAAGRKMFVVLLDPDKCHLQDTEKLLYLLKNYPPDFIFVGGSQTIGSTEWLIHLLKERLDIPVVLFPGNVSQFAPNADALLFLSLLSGRNPEYLVGQHVTSASAIHQSGVEVIPTAYLLIDGGKESAVQTISQTTPIAATDTETAIATALAGEMLGMKMVYLEAGSGALQAVPEKMIAAVKERISVPLIVGGGIKDPEKMKDIFKAGADIVVIGNVLESELGLIEKFWEVRS